MTKVIVRKLVLVNYVLKILIKVERDFTEFQKLGERGLNNIFFLIATETVGW
jgi:hypothetical protein